MKTHDALMAAIEAIETHSGDEEGDVPEWLQPVVEKLTALTTHDTWGYSASTLEKFLKSGSHKLTTLIDMIMAEDDDDPGEADIEYRLAVGAAGLGIPARLTWQDLRQVESGTKLMFVDEYDEGFNTIVPAGTLVTVDSNELGDKDSEVMVLMFDDPALEERFPDSDGVVIIGPVSEVWDAPSPFTEVK